MDLKSFISKINSTLDDFERSGREYELQKQAAFAENFLPLLINLLTGTARTFIVLMNNFLVSCRLYLLIK